MLQAGICNRPQRQAESRRTPNGSRARLRQALPHLIIIRHRSANPFPAGSLFVTCRPCGAFSTQFAPPGAMFPV